MSRLTAFGDRAVRFAVPSSIGERRALLARLRGVRGVRDVVLCEELGCVVFEEEGAEHGLVEDALAAPSLEAPAATPARRVVPVVYDGDDLDSFDLPRDEVIRRHTGGHYVVSMLGFLPGFAYLRGLPRELCRSRRAPRPRVPARSVAIGAEYTGIYPVASAGGWHLLGRALETPPFELGDEVRFAAVSEAAGVAARVAAAPAIEAPAEPRGAHLVVTRVAGLALFVDGGRPGQMHRGMPPGGPLVRAAFASANAAVGNGAACAIELTGMLEVEARGGAVLVAGGTELRAGERFTIASQGARAVYLAVPGGFDAPVVEGSRNALLPAGIGRPLRRGDVLNILPAGSAHVVASAVEATSRPIALCPGPDLDDELRAAIEGAEFEISAASDRAGTRLKGPALPARTGGTRASTPMVEGAVELTPSGLLVLGPDHPTTGGYPVPAVVASASRDAFFARPLGGAVRFTFRE